MTAPRAKFCSRAGPRASTSREAWGLWALCTLGALVRVVSVFFDNPLHPDEFFQYLEPAYTHLTGVGLEAWEFRDGLRSWVLPFYNGAWLAAFMAVGVEQGELLVRLLQLQSALFNALLVWLAYRGGASVARKLSGGPATEPWAGFSGGAFAAGLCACFPLLVLYSGHTLSEQPSMLLLVAGLVEISELSEAEACGSARETKKAALAGFLLSLGACLRIANGPLVLIAPIWLLATRRYRAFYALVLAALLPALVFCLVDLLTWGTFAHSYIAYIKFNFIEGKAARFGTAPAWHYLECLWKRAPFTAPFLFVLACWGVRRSYFFMLPALFGLFYLSTQPHKEERFILFFWPLLFIAAGAVLATALARARVEPSASSREQNVEAHGSGREQNSVEGKGPRSFMFTVLPFVLALATIVDGAFHVDDRSWLGVARFRAESVVAHDATLTGLMIDAPIYAGGALWLGTRAPHFDFAESVLPNPLITHVVVESDSKKRTQAEAQGFKAIRYVNELVILRRLPAAAK